VSTQTDDQSPESRKPSDAAPTEGEAAPSSHGRPTVWIVLCAVLALAVVGLGIWALTAQSDADDAQAKLGKATAAAAAGSGGESQAATPTATAQPAQPAATATPDAATQQAIDELATTLGATNENLASIQQDLEKAAAGADDARKAKADASNALERAQAAVAEFKANAQLASACLRGVLEAVKTAFSSGGPQAALDQATALAGSCRGAAS
jgi:predicted phage tail protein